MNKHSVKYRPVAATLLGLLIFLAGASQAAEYNFVVQPILPPNESKAAYAPLIAYLNAKTGHTFKQVTAANFVGYWETMKRNQDYDLILDAAHFTDYRAKRMGYNVLAKVTDVVSYSLVTAEGANVIDPEELIGKTVATIGSPGLGAVRLEQMFPNPLRQPVMVETNNSRDAIDRVMQGKATGAIVPTPMVGAFPDLITVATTEQVPHMAFSASQRIPKEVQDTIRDALIKAIETTEGQTMLRELNLPAFENTSSAAYDGYTALLEGVWGY